MVGAIKKSGAGIDVVSLQTGDEASQPLKEIAAAGKGSVLTTADPAALTAAFAREADVLARQVVVTAKVPSAKSATSANVSVTVPTDSQRYTATAYVPVRLERGAKTEEVAAAVPAPVSAGPLDLPPNVMFGAVGAIGIGLIGMIAALAMGSSGQATNLTLSEQVNAYGVMAVPGQSGPRQDGATSAQAAFTGQARQVAEKALANNKNLEARIASALEGAGLDLRPAEWLLLRAAITVGGGLVGVLIGAGSVVIGLVFIVAAIIGPTLYLKVKKSRRLGAFGTGLADTLQLMSGSLSAGLSLGQSIDTIVREGNEPIASEFRRVVVESRLGVTLEDSLEGVAQRMESKDFEWVVMAIRIQRQVGGNLAELLLTVAATLREREYLRRHVKALSAEGRLSAYILGGLPPAFLLYLTLSKPDYVHPLWTTPIGWIMCIGMAVLLGVGVLLDVQGREGGPVSTVILIGFGMIFVALFLVFAAIGGLTRERGGVNRSIAVLEAITAAPEEMTRELDAVLLRPGAVPAARPLPAAWAVDSRPRTRATGSARSSSWPATPWLDRRTGDGRQGRRVSAQHSSSRSSCPC